MGIMHEAKVDTMIEDEIGVWSRRERRATERYRRVVEALRVEARAWYDDEFPRRAPDPLLTFGSAELARRTDVPKVS